MWLVSKPFLRHTFVVLGSPGNGLVVQSANAQSLFGITSFASCWCTRCVIVKPVLSVLTASYVGAAERSCVDVGVVRMYSPRTWPVIGLPSLFVATGRLMRSPLLMSPSQPLKTSV